MAILAIDAGGTRIKLGIVEGGAVLARRTIEARSEEGLEPQLERILDAVREIYGGDIDGVGMAFPSIIEPRTGRITIDSGKYKDALSLDLCAWARDKFGAPLAIENDARLATIGEWKYGAGRGYDDIVMVTLGTGIGTGVIQGGRVIRGKHGHAGNLGGHFVVNMDGRRCLCGAVGCVEAEASSTVLPLLATADPEFEKSPLQGLETIDYGAVFKEAQSGDPTSCRLRDRSIEVWGALALTLVQAYDPEIFIFGGGILASGETILAPIRRLLENNNWSPWGKVKVVASALGDDAALVACEELVNSAGT